MTDEELREGAEVIQKQLAEIRKKSRSQQLRNILADIDSWTEESAEHLIRTPGENLSMKTKWDIAKFLHLSYIVIAKDATRSKPLRKLLNTLFREHVSLFCRYINGKISEEQQRHDEEVS